jgi:LemA protein
MEEFEDKLNKHIDKVLELQRNKETRPLSLQELKELDLSLGMTEEEWIAMMKKADDYVQMANSHIQYGNFIEAYKAAESAVSINPYHQEALLVLANSALGKYESDQKDEFLLKAQEHANELLKVNPKQQTAIQILAKVRSYLNTENSQKKNLFKYGIIALTVILIIIGYFLLRPTPVPEENTVLKNELIEAEESSNSAWAQVENVIARRDQLLPQLLELAPATNSEAIKLKSEIEDLRKKIDATSILNEKIELNNQLNEKLKLLMTAINSGSTNQKTDLILVQIEGSYNRISVESKRYNDIVRNYNILVKKYGTEFPQFKEKPYFTGK